jgi:transcriptional regulator with XRE-family HTH domain
MVSANRFQIFMAAHGLTSSALAVELGVSTATVDRYRNGHSPVSAPVQRLMAKTWPKWWDFLTEQSNVLPNPEPQPEPVRVVEEG